MKFLKFGSHVLKKNTENYPPKKHISQYTWTPLFYLGSI